MNNYIIISGNKYIKNDFNNWFLFLNFITQGIKIPKFLNYKIIRFIIYKILFFISYIIFKIKLNRKIFKNIDLNDDFIFQVIGVGNWNNIVTLKLNSGKLIIEKLNSGKDIFQKEQEFYSKYKNNKSNIKLPHSFFIEDNNLIKMEFLKLKSLKHQIIFGEMSFSKAIKYFELIKNEIKLFYGDRDNNILIHGDLGTPNIYIGEKEIYLIDFTDSFIGDYKYDLYVLLKNIYNDFGYMNIYNNILGSKYENIFLEKIGLENKELYDLENLFFLKTNIKHEKK